MFLPRPLPQPLIPSPIPGAPNIAVRAQGSIPADVTCGPYPGELQLGFNTVDSPVCTLMLEVSYVDGTIVSEREKTSRWMLYVQPARDRHEQNVEAIRDNTSDGKIIFRTLREIKKDEHLLVWFADDLAREVGLPFLTPDNIRGDQEYVCSHCPKSYRYPNSLKAHMHYWCPRREMASQLHERPLAAAKLCEDYLAMGYERMRRLELARAPLDGRRAGYGLPSPTGPMDLHLGATSAFKPHRRGQEEEEKNSTGSPACSPSKGDTDEEKDTSSTSSGSRSPAHMFSPFPPHPHPFSMPVDHAALRYYYSMYPSLYNSRFCCGPMPPTHSPPGSYMDHPAYPYPYGLPKPMLPPTETSRVNSLTEQAMQSSLAHLEHNIKMGSAVPPSFKYPIPSEKAGEPLDMLPRHLYMSKSRKGHLCIYCGKLYSRKYGLKIHLRTHTGYKPLKCKVCLRPFGDPSNLNKHIRLHAEGDTPYRCEFCGKVLVRRRDLERHIKSRHPGEAVEWEQRRNSELDKEETEESDFDLKDMKIDIEKEQMEPIIVH